VTDGEEAESLILSEFDAHIFDVNLTGVDEPLTIPRQQTRKGSYNETFYRYSTFWDCLGGECGATCP